MGILRMAAGDHLRRVPSELGTRDFAGLETRSEG